MVPAIRLATSTDAVWISGFMQERWNATTVVVHGEIIEAATLPALIATDRRGLATYRRLGDDAELVTLDAVPPGADAYLLKYILHDWDDARAIKILSNCRTAMARDARLLIVERMLPELAARGRAAEAYLVDLEMLVSTPGGRERTESEFRAILSAAGFATTRIAQTSTPVCLIEARPS